MKRSMTFLVLILGYVTLAFSQTDENLFHLSFEQSGKTLAFEDGVISLAPVPFHIKATFEGSESLYLNFSTNPDLYNAVVNQEDFQEILGFGGTGMAEALGNPDLDIYLVDDGWHVWFVQNSDVARFDQVIITGKGNIGIRTVESLYDALAGERLSLGSIDRVYAVLADAAWSDGEYEVSGVQAFVLEFD
jgi:hypothetical protein